MATSVMMMDSKLRLDLLFKYSSKYSWAVTTTVNIDLNVYRTFA